MTAAESIDLRSPDLTRTRVVEWQAPGPVAKAALSMSGIEAMRAIRDGRLPPPADGQADRLPHGRGRAGAHRDGTRAA
ncbi:hypothetical protein ACVMIH_000765 [Bradyrhizobium sp. USDA 4503]